MTTDTEGTTTVGADLQLARATVARAEAVLMDAIAARNVLAKKRREEGADWRTVAAEAGLSIEGARQAVNRPLSSGRPRPNAR